MSALKNHRRTLPEDQKELEEDILHEFGSSTAQETDQKNSDDDKPDILQEIYN